MPTKINAGQQVQPGTITRSLINTNVSGSAIITKVIAGSGISLSSTGVDTGTGDVTISNSLTPTRSTVNDANYSAKTTDQLIAVTAITATRTITLPAASSFPATRLIIIDESGNCNGNQQISIVPASTSDFINGTSGVMVNVPYGFFEIESNGSHNWTVVSTNFYQKYGAVRQEFFPSAGTTSFSIPGGYNVGMVDVYVNGIKLTNNDFTATDGANVVLGTATSAGDDVQIIGLSGYSVGYALAGNADAQTGTSNNLLMTPKTTKTSIAYNLANNPLLGTTGASGSPVTINGAKIDGTGIRIALTSSGYTVPQNTSLIRFIQSSVVSSATVTLPTAYADGQELLFLNYNANISNLTFSPAITGFSNGSGFNALSPIKIRWDATDNAWYREQ